MVKKAMPKKRINVPSDQPQLSAIKSKQTKVEVEKTIAEETGLTRKEVCAVLSSLGALTKRHIMKRGSGELTLPSIGVKVRRVQRKARMARNPQTGQAVRVPAKTVIKATPLKPLKDALAA